MPPANPVAKLLSLFEGSSADNDLTPAKETFKALKLNVDRLDSDWGRRRLRGVRLAAFLLRNDSETMHRLICTDELATYQRTVHSLRSEAVQLKKSAALVDKAAKRVAAVIARCERERISAQTHQKPELTAGQA